jgi:predicted nuclease of predicted toxin-antitoxin system
MAGLQTEFEFVLPKGFVDNSGNMHRKGIMRLATAMDEIIPLKDPRVRNNQAYLSVILLSRVITKLGILTEGDINTGVIERLYSADLAYLQALYNRINSPTYDGSFCPTCNRPYDDGQREEVGEEAGVGG